MSDPTLLFLIRHARPAALPEPRCVGRLDHGLAPEGEVQARRVAAALRGAGLSALYTSPSGRAFDTARAIGVATGIEPVVCEAIAEIDFGELEGRPFDEIRVSHPRLYDRWMASPTRVRFPGGESYDALRSRAGSAIATMREAHRGEAFAVVTHAGVIRAILAGCLMMPDSAIFRLEPEHAAVTVVEWLAETALLRAFNLPAAALSSPDLPVAMTAGRRG